MNRSLLFIFLFVAGYYFFQAVTTVPWEGDSLAYHIPIAKLIMENKIWQTKYFSYNLFYYPATAESILAGMMFLSFPVNLFNWLAWVVVFWQTKKWQGGNFAVAICLMPSILRLITTQTVDIWLLVFWLAAFWAVKNHKSVAGLFLGLLLGTKYSGLFYALALVIIVGGKNLFKMNFKQWLVFGGGLMVGGGWWYLRNWWQTGDPLYPGSFLGWAGDPSFKLLHWQAWMNIWQYPQRFFTAMTSEFQIWWLGFLALPVAWVKKTLRPIIVLAYINLGLYLLSPSWPENVLSDLRYLYVAVVPMLAVWFEFLKNKTWLFYMTLACGIVVLPQLNYQPKLNLLMLLLLGLWIKKLSWRE